ncbi:hypothetical protein N7452_006910 [Penicillium brevicompactum]|uniref:Uncharacterized protein n=1 Tax=Penicillium brevicompactum TaxID=5074 RepID=A0A9W9QEE1_PENBR|nr:hypothetical protein N7452_006910 [Penicillium brevicompactum]
MTAAMSVFRTIFHCEGVPILEENPSAKEWIALPITKYEVGWYSDEELMNLVIESLHFGHYDSALDRVQGVHEAITLAEFYREDIIDGKIAIDREYLTRAE